MTPIEIDFIRKIFKKWI